MTCMICMIFTFLGRGVVGAGTGGQDWAWAAEVESSSPSSRAATPLSTGEGAVQPSVRVKEVPGPIRFELTTRAELKYEQTFFEQDGHMIRAILSGSYVIPRLRMSLGFDEIPLIRHERPGQSEDWMLGDVVLRYGYVPYISPRQDLGAVLVANLTLPTGDFEGGAGAGLYNLEPRFFLPYKVNPYYTVVPAAYYQFTLGRKEKDVQELKLLTLRLINIFYPTRGSYLILEPRLYRDFESNRTSGELRLQVGTMVTSTLSAYLEYSAGIGGERYFDGRIAAALRYFLR